MKENALSLINILINEEHWVKSSELAIRMNISTRSIKSYINDINDNYKNLIESSKNGYKIDKALAIKVIKDLNPSVPESPRERINYIVKRLANCSDTSDKIELFDLSEELFVSYETIKKDISKAKKVIEEYGLEIVIEKNKVYLLGSEKNKRELLAHILYKEFSNNILNVEFLKKPFPDYDFDVIKNILLDSCKRYNYTINEYSLNNLIISIMISMDRIKQNFTFKISDESKSCFGFRENELSIDITNQIEAEYGIHYNSEELEQFKVMLIGYLLQADFQLINEANIHKFINKEDLDIINQLIKELKQYHFLDVSNSDFIVRFALHIKNLILRLKSMNCTRNPLVEQIRNSCPLIFDCAVAISYKLEQLVGYKVNDDEIAFIALHIGSALVHEKAEDDKVEAVLLFPQYYDFASKLAMQIKEEFSASLNITRVITTFEELKFIKDYDLVISTIPLASKIEKEYVLINPFFFTKDKSIINSKVEAIKLDKKKAHLKKQLLQISSKEFFIKNYGFYNEEEAIKYMSQKMHSLGYVDEDFYNNVIEREKSSSTAFDYIAIPHGMKANSLKTGMFILLNEKPINWGGSHVNIVILFAINSDDLNIFHDVFDNLITLLLEKNNANNILKSESYEQCINSIINCL